MAEFSVEDFSGGETDKWRNNNDPRFYKEAKNMYITEQRTLETRPGLGPYSVTQRPYGNQAVEKIWHHITRNVQGATTGSASSPQPYSNRYQTFVSSNLAVRVNENTDTNPELVKTPEDNNKLSFADLVTQGNYVRLNDNEFVVIPKHQGVGSVHPQKFYRGGTGPNGWRYVALGLPFYTGSGFNTTPEAAGTNSWTYAMVLKHEYTLFEPGAGFITKIVRSTPVFSDTIDNVAVVGLAIPAFEDPLSLDWVDSDGAGVGFVNDNDFAYDDIVIEIYRTKDNGTVFYKNYEIPNTGDPSFPDGKSDTLLEEGELLYTTGGFLGNDMTNDRVQFGTFANDALWLFSSSRGWQSKVGIYDAHPGSFNFRVREGEQITGCNTIDIYPIVGTRQGIYRIEGIVDDLGNGTHRVRTISEEHGCMSNRTMVRAKNKIFFWSDDGIYETNGYQARKVSGLYDTRYNEIVNRVGLANTNDTDIVFLAEGSYDVDNERLMWIFPTEDGDTYSRSYIVMHLRYKHEEGYAITSGELSHDCISISAANGAFFITTADGSILKEDPERYNDIAETVGGQDTRFNWNYIGCSLSFGSRRVAKWFTRLIFTFQGRGTPLTTLVEEDTDESESFRELNSVAEPTKSVGQYLLKRWFQKGRIRGKYKQIRLQNGTRTEDEKVELTDLTIEYKGPGEGITQSDRT